MNKDTRNAIERATQRARKLLEEDFAAQLEGDFDVLRVGTVAPMPGSHLSPRQVFQRDKVVAAIEHKRAAGMSAEHAVADYLRDAAFTMLNRFVAFKMLEARELVQECITKGEQSAGYREFCGLAPGVALLPENTGYRLYIESLFDELSTEVKVLFDRRDASSVLWPKRTSVEGLLQILNTSELAKVWGEDETIGWVYQYFNGQDERRTMREESQAPRSSRELAVRNQFFTPRYVVQFLTDNTLGRIWYEMRGTKTALADRCEYMVRKPSEEFAARAKKDPRDLRVLDPACGSGHFLLYTFDLLLEIYEEAYTDAESPKSAATGKTLAEDYPSIDELRKAVPGLVLAQNLHGVDIDPRCAQIAQLALWMRAQKAYRDLGVERAERAQIRRSNIVAAEPFVADEQVAKEFVATLGDAALGRVFTSLVESLSLAGDLGLLLRIEQLVKIPAKQQSDLFQPPEERIRAALERFVQEKSSATDTRRRMFTDDAAHGVALFGIAEKKFDTVLMNPPFGLMPRYTYGYLVENYPDAYYDLAATFMARGVDMLTPTGRCGAITSRAFMMVADAKRLRANLILPTTSILADLGSGVMDGAAVDASAQVLARGECGPLLVCDVRECVDKAIALSRCINHAESILSLDRSAFSAFPGHQLAYDALKSLSHIFTSGKDGVEPSAAIARSGATTFDDERFLRARWEVAPESVGPVWLPSSRTAEEFSLFYFPPLVAVKWVGDGREVCAWNERINGQTAQARQGSAHYGTPGAVFARRSSPSIAFRAHPSGCAFASNTGAVLPREGVSAALLIGVLNSTVVRAAVNALSNRDSYTVGHIKRIRWPSMEKSADRLGDIALKLIDGKHWLYRIAETDPWFDPFESIVRLGSIRAAYDYWSTESAALRNILLESYDELDKEVATLFGVENLDLLRQEFGLEGSAVVEPMRLFNTSYAQWLPLALSIAIGMCFGRWSLTQKAAGRRRDPERVFEVIPRAPGRTENKAGQQASILVDDHGHKDDIESAIRMALQTLWPSEHSSDIEQVLGAGVRDWLARRFFEAHLATYTTGKRKAPIYWQLATPSAGYSVWLYIHAFSKDTLFRVQNDYVAPKLAHEERRLELLTSELRDGTTVARRSALAAQDAVVEELRAFLDEVKRVAPLWRPNLDDGVIINFAPLWRLVPQSKSWQKQLKATWDALCDGKYDWSQLAAHLWPERVVPKCATDRSLAIAHGLEDVFWLEGPDGKWTSRRTPTHSIDELVRERTSPAVKAALKSLVEAPIVHGGSGRGRRGRAAASADEGGSL